MKDKVPKVFKLVKTNSKIISPRLVPRRVIFLIKSKACCFNYYIISIHQSIQDFSGKWGAPTPRVGLWTNLLLPPANEVCEGYVFTPVCHSVHGRGAPCKGGSPCQGVFLPGGLLAGGSPGPHLGGLQAHTRGFFRQTSEGEGIPGCTEADTPPPQQTATAVGGTHPTGMHSCLVKILRNIAQSERN